MLDKLDRGTKSRTTKGRPRTSPLHLALLSNKMQSNLKLDNHMSYIITDACVKCKYTDCVDVCPVDCFREGELMLVIDPEICIDCGVCEPECPVGAIVPESKANIDWIERNAELSKKWPKISNSKNPLPNADQYAKEENKFAKYCSEISNTIQIEQK